MRVLVVSQYFPPEPGATQNRMGAFVDGLVAHGHEVTVVCEQPNHPAGVYQPGFGRRALMTERRPGLTVHRLWVATSPRKTTARRLAFYGTFAAGAAALIAAAARHDVIFATSPPLPGAMAAAAVAKARRTPFVMDVRDIWPAVAQALGEVSSPTAVRALERVEKWLYSHARRVTATTRPFCRHVDAIAGRQVSVHLPNGALDELLALPERPASTNGTYVVGYAGNMGIAQGLGIVLDAAERLRGEDVRFVLVGDGPIASELRVERDRRELTAVELRPGVPVHAVGDLLLSCDALLIPLGAHPLLADFIPSKLYDAMAVGRPAIVAARGEAAALVREYNCGVAIEPEDGGALAAVVRDLSADRPRSQRLGEEGRRVAHDHARSRQVARLEQVLAEAAAPRSASNGRML